MNEEDVTKRMIKRQVLNVKFIAVTLAYAGFRCVLNLILYILVICTEIWLFVFIFKQNSTNFYAF